MSVEHGKPTDGPVLVVDDLVKEFTLRGRTKKVLRAVDGVSFDIAQGETLALVGESGSGKSTVGRNVIRLQRPTSGRIVFEGEDITHASARDLQRSVRRRLAMVFQNPSTSLNPYLKIGEALAEPLIVHGVSDRKQRREQVATEMERVGLAPEMADRYPRELSGGQRQRVGIARALTLGPSLVLADEPTASLDVSVQAQIVNLLQDLQAELGLAFLFISHDLALVRHISHRVAVLYLGQIMEIGPVDDVMGEPLHPYSAVLASMQRDRDGRIVTVGEIPSAVDRPSGCVFRTRCPIATERCATEEPELREVVPGRQVKCHFPGELQLTGGALDALEIPPPPLTSTGANH